MVVRFELQLLAELGFGLDLDAMRRDRRDATSSTYVSPKSGRAVSRAAGAPYAERMLRLPAFLRERKARRKAAISPTASRSPASFSRATRWSRAAWRSPTSARISSPRLPARCRAWRKSPRAPARAGRIRAGLWPRFACSWPTKALAIGHEQKTDSPRKGRGRGGRAARGAGRALSRLRALHHHEPRAARRARRPQAGAPPHPLRHAAACGSTPTPPSRNRPRWSAT